MPSRKLDETELARKDLIDRIRTVKRLQHRIALRRELNEIEADILREFDDRVAAGKPHELTYADIRKMLEAEGV